MIFHLNILIHNFVDQVGSTQPYGGHSQDGLLVCYSTNCWTFVKGFWKETHSFSELPREWHVSWEMTDGVYLIGGTTGDSRTSSILIRYEEERPEEGFKLKYGSRYVTMLHLHFSK